MKNRTDILNSDNYPYPVVNQNASNKVNNEIFVIHVRSKI